MDFNYAVLDEFGDILRKYRWSAKEAKWHKDQGKNVIKLEVVKPIETPLIDLVGECLF